MKCDTCKMIRVCNELERMEKVPKHEKCRCYSQAKPITNADRIRAMTDEELAKLLRDFVWAFPRSETGWLNWLRKEADDA